MQRTLPACKARDYRSERSLPPGWQFATRSDFQQYLVGMMVLDLRGLGDLEGLDRPKPYDQLESILFATRRRMPLTVPVRSWDRS